MGSFILYSRNDILRTRTLISIAFLLVVAACTQKKTALQLPYFGPKELHPSPFQDAKVKLDHLVYERNPQMRLSAVVNNRCLEERFENQKNNDGSLAFYFYSKTERKPTQATQVYSFYFNETISQEEIVRKVNEEPCIIGISDERTYQIENTTEPLFNEFQRPYLSAVSFETGIEKIPTSKLDPVKIAVIDTGVAVHPELGLANDLPGVIHREDMRSAISKNSLDCSSVTYSNELPTNTHGTFVAGIIAGRANGIGGVGVASNAQIISLAVGDCLGRIPTSEVANALIRAKELQAEIVNLSLGGATQDDFTLRHALVELLNKKTVIVVSAGNRYQNLDVVKSYPASYAAQYPGLITVAWGTQNGKVFEGNRSTSGSNYSAEQVKIVAPGINILSAVTRPNLAGYQSLVDTRFALGNGSSFSAPLVTGAVALTMGYMKHENVLFDESSLEYIVTQVGSIRSAQSNLVRNGAVLNFSKLADALNQLSGSSVPQDISLSTPIVSVDSNGNPEVTFSASFNLPVTHYGARIGIFDLGVGCNYTEPCRIQDFAINSNQSAFTIKLTQNELVPLLASLSDPDFQLNLAVAVYYKVPNGDGSFLNNYGLDAVTKIDLRNISYATLNSKLRGEVTSIRTDQKYLYVQGFACFENSNEAVFVGLENEAGQPITSDFAYSYSLMHTHSGPIDFLGLVYGPFIASDFKMNFLENNRYKAGLEGNPQLVGVCKTLTAAHGYELGVPLSKIDQQNLSGTAFKVVARRGRISENLANKDGVSRFVFPQVNFQSNVTTNIQVNRPDGDIVVKGTVCSKSPSPITIELSYSHWNLACRLKNTAGFPTPEEPCELGIIDSPSVFLYDATHRGRDSYKDYAWNGQQLSYELIQRNLTEQELAKFQITFPIRFPNAFLSNLTSLNENTSSFNNAFSTLNLIDIFSGVRTNRFQLFNQKVSDQGLAVKNEQRLYFQDRNITSYEPPQPPQYWDYYDVGEYYTPSITEYTFNLNKPIGEYLFRNYQLNRVLRETKKYETPLGSASFPLKTGISMRYRKNEANCLYQFEVEEKIENIEERSPVVQGIILAFLLENELDLQLQEIERVRDAMRTIPIDIRFFQDGVMIKHLLSNFGSQTFSVNTMGRQ